MKTGCSGGRWISGLEQRQDRTYSCMQESQDSFAVYSVCQSSGTLGQSA
jgi:hypothetical protein